VRCGRGLAEGVARAGQVAALLPDRAQQRLGLGALGQALSSSRSVRALP
jgi:hypothetical protein